MSQIDGVFTVQERLRACIAVALLALFLLAACGAEEVMETSNPNSNADLAAEQPSDISADNIDDGISEKIVIEQPLPDDYVLEDTGHTDADIIISGETTTATVDVTQTDITGGVWSGADLISAIGRTTSLVGDDWFAKTGRTITPQGSFSLVTTTVTDDFSTDVEEKSIDCLIDITSVGAEQEGYRTVIATLMLDCDDALVWEMIPFDRYTGKAMVIHRLGNGTDDTVGYVSVGGKEYEVGYTVEIGRGSDERASCEYKVTVPDNYDGLMFYVGYANAEIAAEDDALLGESVELDLMPSWGSVSEYFFVE